MDNIVLTEDGVNIPIDTTVISGPSGYATYGISVQAGNVIIGGRVISLSFTKETDIELLPFTNVPVTNNSTVTDNKPPIYEMTEELV